MNLHALGGLCLLPDMFYAFKSYISQTTRFPEVRHEDLGRFELRSTWFGVSQNMFTKSMSKGYY